MTKKDFLDTQNEISYELLNIQITNASLLSHSGVGTLWYHCLNQQATDICSEHSISRLINDLKNVLTVGEYYYDFGAGICGTGWLLQHLVDNNLLDINCRNLLKQIDSYCIQNGIEDLSKNRHDYFFGGTGAMIYLISRVHGNQIVYKGLLEQIKILKDICVNDGSCVYWSDFIHNGSRIIYNGAAHGQASKVYILQKLIQLDINTHESKDLLLRSLEFLNIQRFRHRRIHLAETDWQNQVIFGKSRHAWCHGDLAILAIMYNAASTLGDRNLCSNLIQEMKATAIDFDKVCDYPVVDAGVCHGAFGVAFLYESVYKTTKDEFFKTQSQLWLQRGMTFKHNGIGLAGFQAKNETGFQDDNGLLNGISGIGLVLHSTTNGINTGLEKFLLLE